MAKIWPAMSKWNYDYLRSKVGSRSVQIAVTPDGWADAVKNDIFQLPEERIMKFDDFLDRIEKRISHPPDENERDDKKIDEIFYLQRQNGCLTEDYPELAKDVPKDIGFFSKAVNSQPDAINIWIGTSESISSLHRDPYENIYTVIRGKKIFKLFPPTDRCFIKYETFPVRRYSLDTEWKLLKEPGLETVQWIKGGADKVAKESSVTPIIVEVNEGETLYLPAAWFHEVSQVDHTVAVNYWYDRAYDQSYTKEKFINDIVDQLLL